MFLSINFNHLSLQAGRVLPPKSESIFQSFKGGIPALVKTSKPNFVLTLDNFFAA